MKATTAGLFLLLAAEAATAQTTAIRWSAFSQGFRSSGTGGTVVRQLPGQPLVGGVYGPGRLIRSGFLVHPSLRAAPDAVTIAVEEGWNLLANPVTRPVGQDSVRDLFPGATYPSAYRFIPGVGYQQEYRMQNGRGYWVKSGTAAHVQVPGGILTRDTVDVQQGWNLVAGISSAVDTADITSIPAGLVVSLWYGYGASYVPAAFIQPGRGYWVKVGGAGKIIIGSPVALPAE